MNPPTLELRHIADLSADEERALLSYLNLPPVGALADASGPPGDGDERYEIPSALRAALRKRRPVGGFRSPGELLGVPGCGPMELNSLRIRIADSARYGNRARPIWGGPEAEQELFSLIEGASRCIHLQMYVLGGEVGLRLAELLARKAQEGVAVRVMFTASGFVMSGAPSGTGFVSKLSHFRSHLFHDMYVRKRIIDRLRQAGIPLVDAAPIGRHWKRHSLHLQGIRNPRTYESWQRSRGLPDEWLNEQAAIDAECSSGIPHVDHRKMVLIDGEKAWIGSQNIADSYLYGNELDPDPKINVRRWQWHDNSLILEGPIITRLEREFASRWMLSGGDVYDPRDRKGAPPSRRSGGAVVTVETSRPGMLRMPWRRNAGRMVLSMAGADYRPVCEGENPIRTRVRQLPELAQEDFYAEHCYPSDAELLNHWARVGGRLRDFTLVVPRHYDSILLGLECNRFFPEMLAYGINLWGYRRAILHSKVAVVDGFYVSTGSYNLNLRSARTDMELQFFIQCPEYGASVRERIREDLNDCEKVVPNRIDRFRSRRSIPVVDALARYLFL